MRVLALDYGSARCGVAICDPTGTVVTPIEPVLRAGSRASNNDEAMKSFLKSIDSFI